MNTTEVKKSELFEKNINVKQNINILDEELIKLYYDSNHNYNLQITDYDDYNLCTIYNDYNDYNDYNNIYSDKQEKEKEITIFKNDSINECNFIVIDKQTLKPIITFLNKKIYNKDIINYVDSNNLWEMVEVTKYHVNSKHVCLFCKNGIWFLAHSKIIERLQQNTKNMSNICELFLEYLNVKGVSLTLLLEYSKNNTFQFYSYHFILKITNLCKFPQNNLRCYDNDINLLWICDDNCELVLKNKNDIIPELLTIPYEKKIYFSCFDELQTSLDIMNNEDISSKSIQYGGYFLKILSEDKKIFKCFILRSEVYNCILSMIPKHKNQYKFFLELYQNDKLTDILPFLHKYPADVVRRINMSVKTLSKEILNIYHLTRKKQNCDLYEILPSSYRKVLFDLHKIYVNQKHGDFLVISNELLKDKKSISVDIVYTYLKNIKNIDLIKLFDERRKLIVYLEKNGNNNIISITNIDIITQTELMFSNSENTML